MKQLASITVMALALVFAEAAVAQDAPARAALAPTGKLRVALLPLPHMALRDRSTGQFTGVIIDLGRELARRLDVPVEFAAADSNLAAVDQVKNGRADVTFLVGLPELAAQIDFGPAYIEYETTFLVPGNSAIRSVADIDRPGIRVIAPEPSAIATVISQRFKNVKLVGVPIAISSAPRVAEMLKSGEADAYSNLTHLLSLAQPNLPDWRLVPGSYMMTSFSIGYPKSMPIAASYANKFIEEMKENGFIQQAIDRSNLRGALVPK
jgi:polar amino acid transport system substrate-binding protein